MESWQAEFSRYLFVDIEASGLHANSYPLEVGWCGPDLQPTSFLIKPIPGRWTFHDWSPASEKIHGLGWDHVNEFGFDATDVAEWLNAACQGKTVFSDNPEFDAKWLRKLFSDTGIRQDISLHDAIELERQAALQSRLDPGTTQSYVERIKAKYPHPHRAGADARRAAAKFLALAVPDQIDDILTMV